MRTFLVLAIGFVLMMGTTACAEQTSPVGVWEIRYQDAVGQHYLDVLELRDDGGYSTHMQSKVPSDRGTYMLTDDTITFSSFVNPIFSRDIPYLLEDNVLRIMVGAPGIPEPVYADWQRSELVRHLPQFGDPRHAITGPTPRDFGKPDRFDAVRAARRRTDGS